MSRNDEHSGGLAERVSLPRPIDAKGVVTVELRDENGQVVESQTAENFISQGTMMVYKALMLSVFTRGLGSPVNPIGMPLRDMVLTTATHDADPLNEWYIRGTRVGYAQTDKAYAPVDDYRGTLNPTESFVGEDRVRIVVDFATNQAIGDTGSVYFTHAGTGQLLNIAGLPGVISNPFGDMRIHSMLKHGDKYYVLPQNWTSNVGAIKLLVFNDDFTLESELILPTESTSTSSVRVYRDLTVHNNYLYLASSTGTTIRYDGEIGRIPLSNIKAPMEVVVRGSTMPNTKGSRANGFEGLVYNPKTNTFWARQSTGGNLNILDTNFNVLSVSSLPTNGSRTLHYDEASGEVLDGLSVVYADGSSIDRGGGYDIAGIFDDKMIESNVNNTRILPKIGFTSRFKLPSPVTKTDSVTMKVTYDFLLPTIYDA